MDSARTSEILSRLRDPRWPLSHIRSRVLHYLDLLLPGEFAEAYRRVAPYTMVSNPRLRSLYAAVKRAVAKKIAGDIVECGTARGGSAALMALALKQAGDSRLLWAFDTFEGIPAPTLADPDFDIARAYTGRFRGNLQEVQALMEQLGLAGQVRLVRGLFQETLPVVHPTSIAVLHIDGDWYQSVRCCLENLYDLVSPGGLIQIDDYGYWQGARKATDEFLKSCGITSPLEVVDYSGRLLTKP